MANTFPKTIIEVEDLDPNWSDSDFQAMVCRIVKDEFGNHTKMDYGYSGYSIRFAASGANNPRQEFIRYDARHTYYADRNQPPTFGFFVRALKNPHGWGEGGQYVSYTNREVSGRQRTHDDDLEVELSHECVFYNIKMAVYEYCQTYKLWAFINPNGWVFKHLMTEEEKALVLQNDSSKQKKMNDYVKKIPGMSVYQQPGVMSKEVTFKMTMNGRTLASYNFCTLDSMNDNNVYGIHFARLWTGSQKRQDESHTFIPYTELTTEKIDEMYKDLLMRIEEKHKLILGVTRMHLENAENKS